MLSASCAIRSTAVIYWPRHHCQRPLCVLTFALSSVGLIVRAVQEERRLRVQVGPPYDDYCREVKRLIPFVW